MLEEALDDRSHGFVAAEQAGEVTMGLTHRSFILRRGFQGRYRDRAGEFPGPVEGGSARPAQGNYLLVSPSAGV